MLPPQYSMTVMMYIIKLTYHAEKDVINYTRHVGDVNLADKRKDITELVGHVRSSVEMFSVVLLYSKDSNSPVSRYYSRACLHILRKSKVCQDMQPQD
jgi:hypothetical protein